MHILLSVCLFYVCLVTLSTTFLCSVFATTANRKQRNVVANIQMIYFTKFMAQVKCKQTNGSCSIFGEKGMHFTTAMQQHTFWCNAAWMIRHFENDTSKDLLIFKWDDATILKQCFNRQNKQLKLFTSYKIEIFKF